jgi:RHS repeat-associated protein
VIGFLNPFFPNGDEHAAPYVSPSAFSGRADAGIALWIPSGRGLAPPAAIKWNYGGMNIFGYGFSFSLPYFERATVNGFPRYDSSDSFVHPAYGFLQAGEGEKPTRYYPQTEVLFSRIEYQADTDRFRETLRDGTVTLYEAKILAGSGLGFRYYPASSVDLYGNVIQYHYLNTGEITKIEYGNLPNGGYAFVIDFTYEARLDVAQSFNGGMPHSASTRCSLLTISTVFGEKRKLRELACVYEGANGYSMLSSVTETAFSGGLTETAPPIRISYPKNKAEMFFETIPSTDTNIDAAYPLSLDHEGAAGLFAEYTHGAYYSAPTYSESHLPCFLPKTALANLPACFIKNSVNVASLRYRGHFSCLDGDGELAWITPDQNGYYEWKEGKFEPFTPFKTIICKGSRTEFTDLYQDGKQSAFTVLATGTNAKGEICRSLGKSGFAPPEIVKLPLGFPAASSSKTEFVGFARLFGDGLCHRVLLRQKSCTVFPNLGGGQFANAVQIMNPPDFGEGFDASRICFADTTGSGTDDIIYVEQKQVKIYHNIAGAFFQPPILFTLPEPYSPADSVYFSDFSGEPLPSLVFVKCTPRGTRTYYLRFAHGFFVTGIDGGYGLKFEMEYASSARFRLADTASGRPWDVAPPYHVPVVSQFVATDGITGETTTTRYEYRNGRYVKDKRALYGFQTVTKLYAVAVPLPDDVPAGLLPPERKTVTEYAIGDSTTPAPDGLALIGSPLQTQDSCSGEAVLTRHTYSYQAVAVGGSYFPALVEEEMEQCGANPRICKRFQTYDAYGNVTETKTCFLPSSGANALAEQKIGYCQQTSSSYINLDSENALLLGILARREQAAGTDWADLSVMSAKELFYADPASNAALPLGICKTPALLHHTRDMVFAMDDPDLAGLDGVLREHCGYAWENGAYYTVDEVYEYDAKLFYLPVAKTLGGELIKTSYDAYALFVASCEQMASDGASLSLAYVPDYSVPAYQTKTDIQGNVENYRYDAFGELRGVFYGASAPLLPNPPSLADLLAHPEACLTSGADLFFYRDRRAWEDSKSMPCRVTIANKGISSPSLSLDYYDGYGRGQGKAIWDDEQWIVSEKAVYANEMTILEYLPYFSQEPSAKPDAAYQAAHAYDVFGRVTKDYTPYGEHQFAWRAIETEYEPWLTRVKDARLAPLPTDIFRQDLDSRGYALTDVYESADGDVLRSKTLRDANGNVIAYSDGRLAAAGLYNITYKHDLLSRIVKTVSVDAGTSLKLYGIAGRLVYENAKGAAKTYSYDAFGRFVALSVSSGDEEPVVVEQVTWGETAINAQENNLIGRIYRHTDLSGTRIYAKYDHLGNALAIDRSDAAGETVSAHYTYNLAGELTSASIESFALTFSYRPSSRLAFVCCNGETVSSLCYTAEGTVCSETSANRLAAFQSYDPVTRVLATQSVERNGARIHQATYGFTAQGNLAEASFETQGIPPITGSYSYDAHKRLIQAQETQDGVTVSETYAYDHGGNMVSFTRQNGFENTLTRDFEIAADSNRLNAIVTNGVRCAYSYNAYGAPEQLDNGQKLSYDAFGRLSTAECGDVLEEYSYDSDGNRVSKSISGKGSTVYFRGNPLAGDYVRASDGYEMLKLSLGSLLNTVLLKTKTGEELFLQVRDQRGSVVLTADSQGNILFGEHFSPYGEAATGKTPTIPSAIYRFAGKEYDEGTGLYYFGARYYAPHSGRMITPDDVEFAAASHLSALNLYAYCLNNPESLVDSTGHWPSWLHLPPRPHWVDVAIGWTITGVAASLSYVTGIPYLRPGVVTTIGLGAVTGYEFSAITPLSAACSASFSAAIGAFIDTKGDVYARLWSAATTFVVVGVSTVAINYGKEKVLAYMGEAFAADHPLAIGITVTALSLAVAGVTTLLMPCGSLPHIFLGIAGGGVLGVIGSFPLDPERFTSPKTLGNELPDVNNLPQRQFAGTTPMVGNRYQLNATHGITDFTFYTDALLGNTFFGQSGNGREEHRIIEFNTHEQGQWNLENKMVDMIHTYYNDNTTYVKADVVVIVHGGVNGNVFIDANALRVQKPNPEDEHARYLTLVSGDELGLLVNQMLTQPHINHYSHIKLICCHGGEKWPFLETTAGILARATGLPVIGYDRRVAISETYYNQGAPPVSGILFTP